MTEEHCQSEHLCGVHQKKVEGMPAYDRGRTRNWRLIKSNEVILQRIEKRMWRQEFTDIGDTIIIMWHIPKCGGTTINEAMWSELPEQNMFIFRQLTASYFWTWPSILKNESLSLTRGKITFIEYHGILKHHKYYSIEQMSKDMKDIRPNVEAKGGHIFLFTLLREPIPTVMSYFKYLCFGLKQPPRRACTPKVKDLENFQTNYLAYSAMPIISPIALNETKMKNNSELVSTVIHALEACVDHIGFTESLPETFHALQVFIDKYSPDCNVNLIKYADMHYNSMSKFRSPAIAFPSIDEMRQLLNSDVILYEHFRSVAMKESTKIIDDCWQRSLTDDGQHNSWKLRTL